MFRRTSLNTQGRADSTSPPASPSSPTNRFHVLYQRPSGSRFTEDVISAILSSEGGSDATSLSAWHALRTQQAKLQKNRRRAHRSRSPIDDEFDFVGDSESEMTWTTGSLPPSEPPETSTRSVSFCPAPHPAESFTEDARLRVRSGETPSYVILSYMASSKIRLCGELLQTSLSLSDKEVVRDIIPRRNGFVDTVIEAYNNHRGLIIRPDDVWLAIMLQFNFFVNGNSEVLRQVFVSHEGKRELVVESGASRYKLDTATMVEHMTKLMEAHITDPSLREWIMPEFTTTTPVDRTTCAIVMMGMMKDYFAYRFNLRCGIPKVTLEGEKKDWENILERIEQLKKYGIQTIAWYHLLRPILSRFVSAFDQPNHPDNLAFWGKIAHKESGSGPEWLSGWITAFCVFSEKGKWQGYPINEERARREHEPKKLLRPVDPLQLTAAQFAAVYVVVEKTPYLALDGFAYPTIKSQDVPCGYAAADVTLDDNGEVLETMLIAGFVGAQICSTPAKTELFRNGLRDTVRPFSAWWYYVKREPGEGDSDSD